MASVANMRHHPALRAALDGADEHGDAVRIDRRTRWGNPYGVQSVTQAHRRDADRVFVLALAQGRAELGQVVRYRRPRGGRR